VVEIMRKKNIDRSTANTFLRREQVKAMVKSYIDANEYAYNILRERMPTVIHQIVLAKGQVMGDSSSEMQKRSSMEAQCCTVAGTGIVLRGQ
jgi:predicted transcriptional regulator